MAQDPRPRSFQQILGDVEDGFLSRTGLTSLRVGGPALDLLEAQAQVAERSNQETFSALNASDPTRLRGEALDRYGRSRGVRRRPALNATTTLTITDTSFVKVSSRLSALAPPPAPGHTELRLQSASAFTASGSVYVGRGGASLEGPIAYTSRVDNGVDWTLVLAAPVTRRHDGSEFVTLAQGGDRSVTAGATCRTAQGNALAAATFVVQSPGTIIPDGEVEVSGVAARCTQPGTVGNVPAGFLVTWDSPPFAGAAVTNPQPVTNGRPVQPDEEYLDDIIAAERARSRGTAAALQSFALNVTAPDEPRTSTSASLVDRLGEEPAKLTVDDGSGYQPTWAGVSREQLAGSALGGETVFELSSHPVVLAQVATTSPPPWEVAPNSALAFEVAGVTTQRALHQGTYDPYSLSADVNSDPSLDWEAVVRAEGQAVCFRSRREHQEELRCVATGSGLADAAATFGIAREVQASAFVYLNDQLLHRDGRSAVLLSEQFGNWGFPTGPQTLEVTIDGIGPTTYTLTDTHFSGTGYSALGRNSPAAWAVALSRVLPGVSTAGRVDRVELASNLGRSALASIEVVGGSLVGFGMFRVSAARGVSNDYALNRATGELELVHPLAAGDELQLGSDQVRGYLAATVTSTVTFSDPATWWVVLDAPAEAKGLGVTAATTFAATAPSSAAPWGSRLRLSVGAGTFTTLLSGDYAVFWDPATPVSLRGSWLVAQVDAAGGWLELDRHQGTSARYFAATVSLSSTSAFVCGGYSRAAGAAALATAETYDHTTRAWTAAGSMALPRAEHWAVALPGGDVLVGGGTREGGVGGAVSSPERWDHVTRTFVPTSTTNAPAAALGQAAVLVGTIVYVCGGQLADASFSKSAWSYDVGTDTWTALPDMVARRARHTFVAATGDTIAWAAGGENVGGVLASTEGFDTVGGTWSSGGNLIVARQGHRGTIADVDILLTGGSTTVSSMALTRTTTTERLVAATPPWVAGPVMARARAYHGQCVLSGGAVAVAGGEALSSGLETYDPIGVAWTTRAAPTTAQRQYVDLFSVGTNSAVLAFGTTSAAPWGFASSEFWNLAGNTWSATEILAGTSFALPAGGAAFGSANDRLRRVRAGAASSLTATAIQAALNAQLLAGAAGMLVDRRRTAEIRWRTNTWSADLPGSLFLAAADIDARKVGLPEGVLAPTSEGQGASLLSSNSDIGTPEFEACSVIGVRATDRALVHWNDTTNEAKRPSPTSWLIGLSGPQEGYTSLRRGQSRGHAALVGARSVDTAALGYWDVTVRQGPEQGYFPLDRVAFVSPWAVGAYDDLVLVGDADGDHRRYDALLYRRLQPAASTYGITGEYLDAVPSPSTSLAVAFGIGYDFTDHAVLMRARVKTHAADASRSVLWRWWRHGFEGETAEVSYVAPSGPNQAVAVTVNDVSDSVTRVGIALAGGAAKQTSQIRPSTFVGVCAPTVNMTTKVAELVLAVGLTIDSAVRGTNVTALTLALPTGVTDHGLIVGNLVYVASTSPNFSSGLKYVSGRTATDISYAEVAANAGPELGIGTVSRDLGEARLDAYSPAVAVGDWVRLSAGFSSPFVTNTFRLKSSGPQVFYLHATSFTTTATTGFTWVQLQDPARLQLFPNPAQTTSAVAAAVHALYDAGLSPVEPTLLGTGAGTLSLTSDDEAAATNTWFLLRDGRNAVASQVAPGSPAGNYSFTLRDAITPALATGSDWANEDVRLCPVTAPQLAAWLQSAAGAGAWPGIRADPATGGHHLQLWSQASGSSAAVQVAGGSGNSWSALLRGPSFSASASSIVCSIAASAAAGFVSGGWAKLQLGAPAPRSGFSNAISAATLTVLSTSGQLSIDTGASPALWGPPPGATAYQGNLALSFERQGRYMRVQDEGFGGATLDLTGLREGDWVRLSAPLAPTVSTPQLLSANAGIFRVVRAAGDSGRAGTQCFWVETGTLIESPAAEADVRLFADGSVLPGDIVTFGGDAWGASNMGEWTVSGIGDDLGGTPFNDRWTINLDTSVRSPVAPVLPAVLGSQAPLFRVVPLSAQWWIKRVRSLVPAADGSGLVRVRLSGAQGWEVANESHAASLTTLDKLEFSTDTARGRDAYSYHTGLVGEVNRVLVGEPDDPVSYPGVTCASADLVVDGPRIRRTYFAVAVRLRRGYAPGDAQQAVRSAIVAAIHGRPHGQPIPISDLLTEAGRVQGVESVAPLYSYSSSGDMLPVQPGERARVLDPTNDISVTVQGG